MHRTSPPKVAEWIISALSDPLNKATILGDIAEDYKYILERKGSFRANLWYTSQIIRPLLPFLLRKTQWSITMFSNYLKIALRNIKRYPGYSFLNIAGLAVGLSCAILILLWVQNELSYDRFHENADRIYRVGVKGLIGNTEISQNWTPAPMPEALKKDFPEVEQVVKLTGMQNTMTSYEDKVFNEERVVGADSTFFEVFSFRLLRGDPKTVLVEPGTIVLSEETAKRYFGNENPIGRNITFNGNQQRRVTGVMENFPANSHFHFDILVSMSTYGFSRSSRWLNNNFKIYLVLQEEFPYKTLEEKFPDFVERYVVTDTGNLFTQNNGNFWAYFLQPLTEIHLTSELAGEFEPNGSIEYVYIFTIVAVFILLIACINFMNLSTARSSGRAREIGMRKVVGSTKTQLVLQHIGESLIVSYIALLSAVVMVYILLPFFNDFLGRNLKFVLFDGSNTFIVLIGLAFVVGIISGSYPALFLSSFRPIAVIAGKLGRGSSHAGLRNALVVFQFAITITLFIGTSVVGSQLEYFQNKNLGFSKEQVVVINNPVSVGSRSDIFKNELRKNADVRSVAGSHTIPGRAFNNIAFRPQDQDIVTLNIAAVSPEFIDVMQLELTAGRFFSNEIPGDSLGIILNETAVKLLGWDDDPLGKIFPQQPTPITVIGVVRDFHYESLRTMVRPMALLHLRSGFSRERYISARINTENIKETINRMEDTWKRAASGQPFEYFFLDEDYDNLYGNEMQTGKIFWIFSFLAIIIAAFGLFGLALFVVEQRTKEIGIRKALGAAESKIFYLLSKEFVKWVVLANVIAWPLAYYAMDQWLQGFAYRTSIGLMPFFAASAIAILISLLTVSTQSLKAANANPVESLRYE